MSGVLAGQFDLLSGAVVEPTELFDVADLAPATLRGEYRGQCPKPVRGGGPCLRPVRADGMCDRPSRHVREVQRCTAHRVKGQRIRVCERPLDEHGRCDHADLHCGVQGQML